MLYEKNSQKELSKELFENPTSEYRGAPFWAWNGSLTPERLLEQIEYLKEMGMGGFHIHVRTGMDIPYLSQEYMDLVKLCLQKGKEEGMLTWLYDEDRWPSGAAGGFVTREKQYRARYLLFTQKPYGKEDEHRTGTNDSTARAERTGNGRLLACYDVILNPDGTLKEYQKITEDALARGTKWYAYLETPNPDPWYNNQTYVNTLDKKAIQRFVEITHEAYFRQVGEEFGKTIPAIFTDEPQFTHKTVLQFSHGKNDVTLPWTDDLPDTFAQAYGENLMEYIPQLLWDLPHGKASLIRYHYHDHIAERFASAFSDTCGNWCREHHLKLTGHMMQEPTLYTQTAALGEAMRSYRAFDLPGIDMLCGFFEYTTAKQAQSAVHQYGYEGMTSELYGAIGWDLDFRGHKLHGDWQAALGVTIRVPHLSWFSMAGEAKRDFPAPINYQSPWFREYPVIENHFARLNTAMTRGCPVVKVGVIHPIESYWLHWGPAQQTALIREQLDENFANITKWLLFGGIDFDFICESLFPSQCKKGGNPLQVGKMAYDVVIVPGCETLRAETVQRLKAFRSQGGKLIFLGKAPALMDAKESREPAELAAASQVIPFLLAEVLQALEEFRLVEMRNEDGTYTDNLIYQMRQDGETLWLFVAHGVSPYSPDVVEKQSVIITIKGRYIPTLYHTLTGEISPIPYRHQNGDTILSRELYEYDSLLLQLVPCSEDKAADDMPDAPVKKQEVPIPRCVPITLTEPNVLMLDMTEYSLDGEPYHPEEELLIADNICRKKLGWPSRKSAVAQPWATKKEAPTHQVALRFTFESQWECETVQLAAEDVEAMKICWNGQEVQPLVTGWYVDHDIHTIALPPVQKGVNVLELKIPFSRRTNIEWCYLLGDFGVQVKGCKKTMIPPVRELSFSDIVPQGLPFYGGNIIYHIDMETGEGPLMVEATHFRGALMRVDLDGENVGRIFMSPYTCEIRPVPAGRHQLEITLLGNRYNTFGQVHLSDKNLWWQGPDSWRTTGSRWSYEYQLKPTGLLSSPHVYGIKDE